MQRLPPSIGFQLGKKTRPKTRPAFHSVSIDLAAAACSRKPIHFPRPKVRMSCFAFCPAAFILLLEILFSRVVFRCFQHADHSQRPVGHRLFHLSRSRFYVLGDILFPAEQLRLLFGLLQIPVVFPGQIWGGCQDVSRQRIQLLF